MKRAVKYGLVLALWMSLAGIGLSDTLVLKDGREITGYYEGGTSRLIQFRTGAGVEEFDLLSVAEIRFGGEVTAAPSGPPPAASPSAGRASGDAPPVRLQSREEAEQRPQSGSAANTGFTIPTGSKVLIRLIDAIDSESSRTGQTFAATLADPLMLQGIQVAPEGADIRGRIVEADDAGRVRGSAELRLELNQIVVNGIPYAVATSEYEEAAEGRGGETARRVGAGAGIGAVIGAIAGGARGAAIGAGVGAGTAGAVQVLTRGEKLYIPAETLLEFTLRQPLVVAAR